MSSEERRILFLVIVIFCCIVAFIIPKIYSYKLKKKFSEFYDVPLSKEMRVKRDKEDRRYNVFSLNLPHWLYQNKDGSPDRRRNYNKMVYPNSYLYLDGYIVLTNDFKNLYRLVKALRLRDVRIEMCSQEQAKLNRLKTTEVLSRVSTSINDLLFTFSDQPQDFEKFCASLYEKLGYKVTVTPPVNDGGYDIYLERGNTTGIVECKLYNSSNSIGRPLIQKLVGANGVVKADKMIFITTSYFTKGAERYARDMGVEIVDGKALISMINTLNNNNADEDTKDIDNSFEWQLSEEELSRF